MATRTIRQVVLNVRTNFLVPEDATEMEKEQDLAASLDFAQAEDSVNDQLPRGYYCKVEDAS